MKIMKIHENSGNPDLGVRKPKFSKKNYPAPDVLIPDCVSPAHGPSPNSLQPRGQPVDSAILA